VDKGEVEVLYKCIVCGKAWSNKYSLRAHMKIHKGEGYRRTSIHVRTDLWEKFKELCKKHNTTTCHFLMALIEAAIKGEEVGVIRVGAPNPAIINIHQYFLGKPRSAWKVPVAEYTHEVELPCEVCGGPAFALHSKRLEAGWTHIAVCERHHREAERSFYGDAWIPLDRAEVRKVG